MSFLLSCPRHLAGRLPDHGSRGAQYPGRITKTDKNTPVLRSVAVLEWTGNAGKPSASRLVPVAVFDGEQLNDGTIYLRCRPEPLALANGVEYELQTAGKPTGIFDVFAAAEVNGIWQGFGVWKQLTAPDARQGRRRIQHQHALRQPGLGGQ